MGLARQLRRKAKACLIAALASVLFLVFAAGHTYAHKPVTSKYNYNKDIFPLLRDHCASCHLEGGPAPMSLMTYDGAVPWAEAIRDEVTAGRMPPWPVDPSSPQVKGGYPITSREIDTITIWASGGTPEGDPEARPPAMTFHATWKLGPPDLKISMEAEHTVAANAIEETCDFSFPTNESGTKWIKAADLMPGTPSLVRDAVISIENGPVLALWQPGGDTTAAPSDAAFRLAPGSKIHLQIHYKKHFDQEQNAVSDKSTVGLYFTDRPPSDRELRSFSIQPQTAASDQSQAATLMGALPEPARLVALRPMLDRAYESLSVDAITPSGTQVPLLRLHGPRPQWFRRYWLQNPVELAAGTRIEVHLTPMSDDSQEPNTTRRFPLQVALDYISQ